MERQTKLQTNLESIMKVNNERILVLGLDETKRGEFIGSMHIGGVLMEQISAEGLFNLGIKDSKLLSRNKIFQLAKVIRANALKVFVEKVSPADIDIYNLNDLEAKAMARIMNKAEVADIIIADNFEPTQEAFMNRLKRFKMIFNGTLILAEHKADTNHAIVAAASIIAKESAYLEADAIEAEDNTCIGSGNPNDIRTLRWAKTHKDHWAVRKSWQTFKRLKDVKL